MEIRKYISVILLTLVVVLRLTSCGNDYKVEPNSAISQIIIGEWSSELLGEISDVDISKLDINDTKLNTIDSRLVFNANGKGYEIDEWDGARMDFSYTVKNEYIHMVSGSLTQTNKIIKYSDNVIYSLNESEQTIFKLVRRK